LIAFPSFKLLYLMDEVSDPSMSVLAEGFCQSLTCLYIPAKVYENSDTEKLQVYLDNKEKSGIYLWKNLLDGKTYVGSAVDLRKRFFQYYSLRYLAYEVCNSSMYIYKAILKHGHSNFRLEIL